VLPGSVGTCTEEPAGVDLREDCTTDPARTCDKTCGPGGLCIGAGAGTQCAAAHCTDESHGLGPAHCPNAGPHVPCPLDAAVPFDCGVYRCEPVLGACYERCNSIAQCAPGSVCDPSGRCVAPPDKAAGHDLICSVRSAASGEPSFSGALVAAGLALGLGLRRRARR
jgi:MYXO-CTERM domain-containing protein